MTSNAVSVGWRAGVLALGLAGGALGASPARAAPVTELLAVKLGASVQEARQALGEHQPPFPGEAVDRPAKLSGLPEGEFIPTIVRGQPSQGPSDVVTVQFSPPPLLSRAVAVQHNLRYDPKTAPTSVATRTALNETFGKPSAATSSIGVAGAQLVWAWTTTGSLMSADEASQCARQVEGGGLFPSSTVDLDAAVARLTKAGCAKLATASYQEGQPGLLLRSSTAIYDVAVYRVALEKTIATRKGGPPDGPDKAKGPRPRP
jgi:hypothetical protein